MKQVTLKYALVGKRGTLISSTSFKSASGFKLYLGNKLFAEYVFSGDPTAKEKRKLLDDVYFKTLDKFEKEKQREVTRLKREQEKRDREVLNELKKLQKIQDEKERQAREEVQLEIKKLKLRDQVEKIAKGFPKDDNEVYFIPADKNLKIISNISKSKYVLYFKNRLLWPIEDVIRIPDNIKSSSKINDFINSNVSLVDSEIASFIKKVEESKFKEPEIEEPELDEFEFEETKIDIIPEKIKYNYYTDEKTLTSEKLGRVIVAHRKIVVFKDILKIKSGENLLDYANKLEPIFRRIFDKAWSETEGRRYGNLFNIKLITPYYSPTGARVSYFTKLSGSTYLSPNDFSFGYSFKRLKVRNEQEGVNYFRTLLDVFSSAKDMYLKINNASLTALTGFIVEFICDK